MVACSCLGDKPSGRNRLLGPGTAVCKILKLSLTIGVGWKHRGLGEAGVEETLLDGLKKNKFQCWAGSVLKKGNGTFFPVELLKLSDPALCAQ